MSATLLPCLAPYLGGMHVPGFVFLLAWLEGIAWVLLWALAGLAALALIAFVALLLRWRHFPLSLTQTFWYHVNVALSKALWRAKISGPLPIPLGQGAVIACNHLSPIDPCFIELATRRVVRWMVAEEYFRMPSFGWFLRMAEAIPTRRSGMDTAATKAAIAYAKEGGLVGIFPEGRINRTDDLLLPGRSGAAMIALKARTPLLPCFLRGVRYAGSIGRSVFQRAKVELVVGELIDISEYYGREGQREVLETVTRRLLKEIAKLAGNPDYEPRVAHRGDKPKREDGPADAPAG
jgi:1-acyl-sn-glycerol-3-phosphate acyltransferase